MVESTLNPVFNLLFALFLVSSYYKKERTNAANHTSNPLTLCIIKNIKIESQRFVEKLPMQKLMWYFYDFSS